MQISLFQVLLIIGVSMLLALICVLAGGWLVFKSKSAPGEGLFKTPKGQVFTIPDAELAPDNPEEPDTRGGKERVLANTEKFLNQILGGIGK